MVPYTDNQETRPRFQMVPISYNGKHCYVRCDTNVSPNSLTTTPDDTFGTLETVSTATTIFHENRSFEQDAIEVNKKLQKQKRKLQRPRWRQ